MNNSDAEKNTERIGTFLPYGDNGEASASTGSADAPQVQYRSRRERRLSETTAMKIVPGPATGFLPTVPDFKKDEALTVSTPAREEAEEAATTAPEPVEGEVADEPEVDSSEVAAAKGQVKLLEALGEPVPADVLALSRLGEDKDEAEETATPEQWVPTFTHTDYSNSTDEVAPVTPEAQPTAHARRRAPKEYWGGLALLSSFVVFLGAQIILGVGLVIYYLLSPGLVDNIKKGGSGAVSATELISSQPVVLIVTQLFMYASWIGCLWWVTRYRSGVQRGKNFWTAFKDNFRLHIASRKELLTNILLGVGTAAGMFALQFVVLDILIPQVFPSFDMSSADNTGAFKGLSGAWFYIISFGIGGLIGPICEELFFRGFLLRGFSNHFSYKNRGRNLDLLEEGLAEKGLSFASMMVSYRSFAHKHRNLLAAILTTVIFGIVHFQGAFNLGGLVTILFTGLLGAVFAVLALKRNSLVPSMTAHVLYNSTLMVIIALQR